MLCNRHSCSLVASYCFILPLGYASGMELLFVAGTLFIAVILVMVLLQAVLTDAPFVFEEMITLAGMALVCFIPTGFFMRGILSNS